MPRRLGIQLVAGDCCMPTASVNGIWRRSKTSTCQTWFDKRKYPLFPTPIEMLDKFNDLVALLSSSPTFIIASSIIFATVCLLKVLNPGALALLFISIHLVSVGFGRSSQTIGSKNMERVSTREESSGFTQYSHVRVSSFIFRSPLFILF